MNRCQEKDKRVWTPDSGRGRCITPLRVRHQGKNLEFNWKHTILKEKRISCVRWQENVENVSIPDSDRGRLITPLRVRHQGKNLEFN